MSHFFSTSLRWQPFFSLFAGLCAIFPSGLLAQTNFGPNPPLVHHQMLAGAAPFYHTALDGNGDSYVVYEIYDTISISENIYNDGILLVKYNHKGNVIWSKYSTASSSNAVKVYDNAVYVQFTTGQSCTWETTSITIPSGPNNQASVVVKLDTAGNLMWYHRAYNNQPSNISGTVFGVSDIAYTNGQITVSCMFNLSLVLDDTTMTNNSSSMNTCLYTLDTQTGNVVWAHTCESTTLNSIRDLASDDAGNIYFTGRFTGTATWFDTTMVSIGSSDIFTGKISQTGQLVWLKTGGGPKDDQPRSLVLAPGAVYVWGWFTDTCTFGSIGLNSPVTGRCMLLQRYEVDGTLAWSQPFISYGATAPILSWEITSDQMGNCYLGAVFSDSVSFNAGTQVLTAPSGSSMMLAKIDTAGNTLWASSMPLYGKSQISQPMSLHWLNGSLLVHTYLTDSLTIGDTTFMPSGALMLVFGNLLSGHDISGASLKCFPNPADNQLWLRPGITGLSAGTVSVINTLGQAISTIPFSASSGTDIPIDISTLTPGLYFFRINTSGAEYHFRVIVL